jgi:hypothetical protein
VEGNAMIQKQDKNAFWNVVKDCLVEIYGLTPRDACVRSQKLRGSIEETPDRRYGSIFYHAEPLEVANDIAGKKIDLVKAQHKYQAILAKHNW